MAKYIFLSFLFLMFSFFSNAQEIASQYKLPQKNWVKTKPFIAFCGKEEGLILLDSISVESVISIRSPYSFQSLSIYFGGAGFPSPILAGFGIASNNNETDILIRLYSLQDIIKKCRSQTKIVLTNIKVKKDKIIYDAPDVTYIVK